MAGIGGDAAAYVANFQASADAAPDLDFMIEAINAVAIPGYLVDTFANARRLHAAIGCRNVRLQADRYHMQVDGDAILPALDESIAAIGHVQIAGHPGRNETDSAACHAMLNHLDTLGYAGHVGCEYHPAGATVEGLGWLRRHRENAYSG